MKTQQWAERVGREAVELGWKYARGQLACYAPPVLGVVPHPAIEGEFITRENYDPPKEVGSATLVWPKHDGVRWYMFPEGCGTRVTHPQWPDFRDRLTELACVAWVEDVAREVYEGHFNAVSIDQFYDGTSVVRVIRDHAPFCVAHKSGQTLAEACIAAIRAMREGGG